MSTLLADKEGKGNRVTLGAIDKGEPLRQQQISGFGDKSTLSRKIGEDKRAFSLRVNDVSGVAGFLLPGDHVDVMFTRSSEGGSGNLVTDILLQNVTILGVDQSSDEDSKKAALARTVTMEVTPDQAQRLALAQQAGTLSLALRNYANNEEITSGRVSVSDLIGKIKGGNAPVGSDDSAGGGAIRIRRGISVDYAAVP
jgi:pilus assembly protein CpaB